MNPWIEPRTVCVADSGDQPICSIITARLKAAFVAVGRTLGLVVVSDGAQNPPIQYHDCAMICWSRSIGSRVTIATSSTMLIIESRGATSSAAMPAKSPSTRAPCPQMIGRRTTRPDSVGWGWTYASVVGMKRRPRNWLTIPCRKTWLADVAPWKSCLKSGSPNSCRADTGSR